MQIDTDKLTVSHDEAGSRFEIEYEGLVAELTYRVDDGRIAYLHTGVPAELEGHGIAARLAEAALGYARSEGLIAVPSCPYVRSYIEKHPEYEDLLEGRR